VKTLIAAALALAIATPALAQNAAALRDAALKDDTAWNVVRSLTSEVGARPAGSLAAARARDWGVAKLRELGFSNIKVEPYTVTAWERGPESAELTAPFRRPLNILGLGRSIPTPAGGVEGEVVVFASYDAMLSATDRQIAGKIVLVNQPMVRAQDGSGYGAINRNRTQGASEAARRGAIAYLTRSLATDDANNPHTGAMTYAAGVRQIPAAAVSVPDANVLADLAAKGPVRIKLSMMSRTVPGAPAWDVSGEMIGTGRPDEIIVIGGHLDSWDVGTGAVDDAAGIAITTAAAKIVGQARPRRTIRVVMWGAEEIGESGARYGRDHAAEVPKIVAASESDNGAGAIFALALPPGTRTKPEFAELQSTLAPLKINVVAAPATGSGADTAALHQAGVPAFSFDQDSSKYFDLHHSQNDTLEQIDPGDLAQNVAAWTVVLHFIANSTVDLRVPAPAR